MKILDRYIIFRFIGTFFFTVAILMVIAIIVDISEKVDNFIESSPPFMTLLTDYYVQFIFFYTSTFAPVVIFISAIITTSKLSANTEIVAMLSGGMSFNRLLRPFFYAATFFAVISFVSAHWLVPRSNQIRLNFENEYVKRKLERRKDEVFLQIGINEFIYTKWYNPRNKRAYYFTYERYDDSGHLHEKIEASTLEFTSDTTQQISHYKQRVLDTVTGQFVLSYGSGKETSFFIEHDDLNNSEYTAEMLDHEQLDKLIEKETRRGASNVKTYQVQKHQRSSMPFSSYILTFIAVAISYKKKRGGMGINLAFGIVLVFLYVFFMRIFNTMAININFPPAIAVWVPNLIFILISIVIYFRAREQ